MSHMPYQGLDSGGCASTHLAHLLEAQLEGATAYQSPISLIGVLTLSPPPRAGHGNHDGSP